MDKISDWLRATYDAIAATSPVSLWTAVVATFGAYLTWRGIRISHINAQIAAPHIVATNNDSNLRRCVFFHIEGPNKEQWQVVKAKVKWPANNQLCRPEYGQDQYGEQIQIASHPQGRSIKSPTSPLILASLPTSPLELVFTISLKSDPKVKRRCAARIEAIV